MRSSSFASCDMDMYDPAELGLTVPVAKSNSVAQLSLYLDDSGLIVYGAMGVRRKSSIKPSDAVHAEQAASHKRISSALEALDNVVAAAEKELAHSVGNEAASGSVSLEQKVDVPKIEAPIRTANGGVPDGDPLQSVPFDDQPTDSDSTGARGTSLVPVVIVVEPEEVHSCQEDQLKAGSVPVPVETDSLTEGSLPEAATVSEKVCFTE